MPTQFSLKINGSCPDKASDMRELHAPMREFHAHFISIFPETTLNFLNGQVMNCHRFAAKKSVTFPRLAAFIGEMQELDDNALLREYVEHHSEAAFAELVARHVDKVYSTAWRHTRNPHQAGEITQAVFVILAQKAGKLGGGVVLSGWLYQTARLTAVTLLRGEIRRARREQEALMQTLQNENEPDNWRHIAPLLDDALARLGEKDRHAVVLRFFDGKSFGEVGVALGGSEDAAKMRVSRALEKLRKFFAQRGVTLTAAAIAGAVSANSVHAAPVGLAATITATALKGSTVVASTLTLVKGTMKMMTWMKIKLAVGLGAVVLLAGGAATLAISQTNNGDKLTPQEIIQKTQAAYAALSSYSDSGVIVENVVNQTLKTTFNLRLQRPNLYRIDWSQAVTPTFSNTGVVWSAGNGDFVQLAKQVKPEKRQNMEMALAAATGVSGMASATIPGIFFNLNLGKVLNPADATLEKQKDEDINGVDCFVVSSTTGSATGQEKIVTTPQMAITRWIGKQDFLVHQIKVVMKWAQFTQPQMSDGEIGKILEGQNKPATPEAIAAMRETLEARMKTAQAMMKSGPITFTQTHENISVNQKFSPTDFAP